MPGVTEKALRALFTNDSGTLMSVDDARRLGIRFGLTVGAILSLLLMGLAL